jgi:hypothetical protein
VLTIRRFKTDRDGTGATVAVPLGAEEGSCPVGALRRWLAAAAIGEAWREVRVEARVGDGVHMAVVGRAEDIGREPTAYGLRKNVLVARREFMPMRSRPM